MAWAYIQQGGSSVELYVSVWDTEDEANTGRQACTDDGAYMTTPAVEIPDDTDWGAVEELVQGLADLDYYDAAA